MDMEQRTHTRLFDRLAIAAMALAMMSAVGIAVIDAGSIAARANGEVLASRPLWLHTFSISIATLVSAAAARWGGRRTASPNASVVYAILAGLNLTVLVLSRGHPDFRFALLALHTVLAALLVLMSLVARHA
jgi:hypothetical protein